MLPEQVPRPRDPRGTSGALVGRGPDGPAPRPAPAPSDQAGGRPLDDPHRRPARRRALARAGPIPLRTGPPSPPGDHSVDRLTHELKASYAFVERNFFLTRRYWGWELAFLVYSVAGALSISLIGVEQGSATLLLSLMIGAIFWNYLSVVFSWIAETIAVERWEGTLEYTMMAPVRRWTQLLGSCAYAIVYGLVHTARDPRRPDPVLPAARPVAGEPGDGRRVHGPRFVQLRRDRDDGRDPAPPLRGARARR